jgi:hypothetical protein
VCWNLAPRRNCPRGRLGRRGAGHDDDDDNNNNNNNNISWSTVYLGKLNSLCCQSRNSPHFYETQRFFTVLTSARHLSLS